MTAPSPSPAPDRPPQVAVAPLNTIAPEDIGAAAAKLDAWLRELTKNYVTLERLTTVAGSIPVVGNVMALVDVLMDVVTIVSKKAVDFLDWVSLGINLIGVIPVPPSMAAARMTLRPTLHLLRQELATGARNVGEALVTVLVTHLNDKLAGEIDTFVQSAMGKLGGILKDCADLADKMLDALADVLHRATGDKPLFDVAKHVSPESSLHHSKTLSTWERLAASAALLQRRAANAVAAQAASFLPAPYKARVSLAATSLVGLKAPFRQSLTRLADEQAEQSIQWLLRRLMLAVADRKKTRSVIVPANKGATVVKELPGQGLASIGHQAAAKGDPHVGKLCPALGATPGAISFATGSESFTHIDFVLQAPLPIEWRRTYRSHAIAFDDGNMGARWLNPFSSRVDVSGKGKKRSLVHHGADGRSRNYPWLEVGQSHRDDIEEVTLTRVGDTSLQLDFGKPLATGPAPEASPWRETFELVGGDDGQHFRLASQHGLDGMSIALRYDHAVAGKQLLSDIVSKQGDITFAHIVVKPDARGRIAALWELVEGEPGRQLAAYTYDHHGDLVQAQDENAATWDYQCRNHLVTRYTDRTGRGNNLEYDHYGNGDGDANANVGDGDGDGNANANANTNTNTNTNTNARVTSRGTGLPKAIREWADDGSRDTRLEWDANIRLTYVTDALGGETWVYYDIEGYTYRVVHPDKRQEWFFRDDAKNLTRHIHTDGSTDDYSYDPFGNLIRQVRADGSQVHFQYDRGHRVTGILDADGGTWRRSYDRHGHLVDETDPRGHKTEYDYDKAGRPVEIRDAKGGRKKLAYSPSGQLTNYTDCSARITQWDYDGRGRLVKRTDAAGNATGYRYTPVRLAAIDATAPRGNAPGRLEAIVKPDQTTERLVHDAEGRLLEHRDALERRTVYRYDPNGLIASRIDAEGHQLAYAWDKLGRLTILRNENGQPYTFKYDPVGRLLEETGFDGKPTEYRYAEATAVLAEIVEGRVTTTLSFDPMGRLTKRQARSGEREQTETFGYYPGGMLGEAKNEHARLQYFYDDAGNLTREHHGYLGTKQTAVWHHRYNELNQRIGTTRPDGHRLEWLTYGSGHVHGLLLDGEEVVGFERDALHREVHRTQANGIEQGQAFDALGQLRQQHLTHKTAGHQGPPEMGRGVFSTTSGSRLDTRPSILRKYSYDTSGQLDHIEDSRRGRIEYGYDAIGRLLRATGGVTGEHETFAFDPAGNILATVPDGHRLRSRADQLELPKILDNLLKEYAGTTYKYDERGNLTERKHNGSMTEFAWDGFDRMIQAKSIQGTTTFAYDPLGRRIGKTSELREAGDKSIASTKTQTLFGWDGDTLAFESNDGSERNGHRGSTVHYIHEAGSFVPLLQARAAGSVSLSPTTDIQALKAANYGEYDIHLDPLWNGDLDPEPQHFAKQDIAFYQCDHLGTPMELTDWDGKVAWEANYKAWGWAKQAISDAGKKAGLKNPIRFQGQYFDEETGLHYNRFRYFEPLIGRYISRDPIGLAGGANVHAYASNPIQWIDPFGLTKSGTATICRYTTDLPTGHYSVKVHHEGYDLHTHQMTTDDHGSTTIVNEARAKVMEAEKPASTATIKLKDAEAAQQYQRSQLGESLGKYDDRTNSCVDHVANVLRAGGENVPCGAGSQMKYLARQGIKIKG